VAVGTADAPAVAARASRYALSVGQPAPCGGAPPHCP
jgi:hypothetical protein